jgi:anti-sigma factor RsiW
MTTPTHETLREQLLDLAYGELDRREERALRKHLEGCAECAAELARMTSTRSTMAALSDEPAPERGQAVLLAAAREAARAQERRPFLPSWLWGASLSAVGLAAVAALSLQLARQAPMTGFSGLEKRPAESVAREPVAHEPMAAPAPVTAAAPAEKKEAALEASKPAPAPAPAGGKGGGAGPARAAKASPPRDLEPRGEGRFRLEGGRGDDRAVAKGDRDGALGALEPEKKQEKAKVAEERVDEGRFAAAPPAEPAPAAGQPAATAPPPPADDAELAEAPAAVASAGAAGAPPGREASPQKAGALRRRAESNAAAAPSLAAPSAAKRARAAEDAMARHARLRALGQLRSVARRYPGCAGEAERTVELDPDDQVVKVTRRGTWQGKPYAAELFYGEDGLLGAVRFSAEGQVRELRAGAIGGAGVPDAVTLPRHAADAGPDAPPRCGL